jgi:hypothetical protein
MIGTAFHAAMADLDDGGRRGRLGRFGGQRQKHSTEKC